VALLDGMRILVVEDEALIAIDIEAQLRLLGGFVIGPEGRLDRALELAQRVPVDGALLDINIQGGLVFPVAEVLLARRVQWFCPPASVRSGCPPVSAGYLSCASPSTGGSFNAPS